MGDSYIRAAITEFPDRPIIHHLNADTSWLVQFPIPSGSRGEKSSSSGSSSTRRYYNVLLDPWLSGSQSDVASWFSQQWHAIPSAYKTIAEVQDLCNRTETLASEITDSNGGSGSERAEKQNGRTKNERDTWRDTIIDVVAISHEFTDHCHKQTLMELPKSTPVFAWSKAAKMIKGWKCFERVIEVPAFRKDWKETVVDPLPPWLGLGRLFNEDDGLYYHAALTLTFTLDPSIPSSTASPEIIIYSPHGLHPPTLTPIPLAQPPVSPLCLLHGLHDVSLDWRQQLNLGAHNGLAAQRMLGAKYWMGTHDEEKTGKGVVSWFLRRKKYTVEEAVEQELADEWEEVGGADSKEGNGTTAGGWGIWGKKGKGAGVVDREKWSEKVKEWEGTGWRDVGNGEALVLRLDGS